jgi:hypothetical protein
MFIGLDGKAAGLFTEFQCVLQGKSLSNGSRFSEMNESRKKKVLKEHTQENADKPNSLDRTVPLIGHMV